MPTPAKTAPRVKINVRTTAIITRDDGTVSTVDEFLIKDHVTEDMIDECVGTVAGTVISRFN